MSEPPQGAGKPASPARTESSPWGPFAWGFTDVTAVAWLALGLVALYTHGAAPLAFALGGLTYVLVGLGYTELASAYPVAGGAQHFVVRGLGDLLGFLAGAALLFDFTLNLAMFALAAAEQFAFVMRMGDTVEVKSTLALGPAIVANPEIAAGALMLVAAVAALHMLGEKRASRLAQTLTTVGLAACASLVVAGFAFAWNPTQVATQWNDARQSGDWSNFAFGTTLVMISFVGLESIGQVAHETRRSATLIPRAALTLVFCVFAFGLALSSLAMGSGPWTLIANRAPLPSLALGIGDTVGLLGAALLALAAAVALRGISRLLASMGNLRLAGVLLLRVTPTSKTPTRAVLVFAMLAAIAIAGASLTEHPFRTLVDLYAFGTTFAYALMLLALIRLRFSDAHTPRPYKLPFNLPWRGRSLPLLAVLGLLALAAMFSTVLATHRWGRVAGPLWLAAALLYYILNRRAQKLPLVRSLERNWDEEQLASLAAAEEFDLLEQYKRAIAERERSRAE